MTNPEIPGQTEKPVGTWWLALRVIDEPEAVFRQLVAQPRALVPIMLVVIVAAIVAVGLPGDNLREQARNQMEAAQERAPDRITDADVERRVERAAGPVTRGIIFVGQVAFMLIMLTVVAAVLMLIFGAMGSEPIKFKDEFAIAAHAYMPQLMGALLIMLLMRFAGADQFFLSLGFMFDQEGSPFRHQLGNQFGLFGAWNVFLLALGNQIRTGGKGIGTPRAIVGGLWVLVNLVFAGLATVFGGRAG